MLNKPKYSLFLNTKYALQGLKDLIQNESSFKIELIIFVLILPIIIFIDKNFLEKLLLFSSGMLILIVESINGAIERVVDLVTTEYHPLAGKAKDAGSSAVLLSVILGIVIWIVILFKGILW